MFEHTHHSDGNCNDPACEDHYAETIGVVEDASAEINIKPPSPELEALVAGALEGIHGRSFSARNPELGKMFKCVGCGQRHRGTQCVPKYKYLHTLEDLETGEKTDIFATVPLPEQVERGLKSEPPKHRFPKAEYGAALTKGKRRHPHFRSTKLQFIELTRQFFVGDADPQSEDYQKRITKARRLAYKQIRKNARTQRNKFNRISEVSRRLNRGFAQNRA